MASERSGVVKTFRCATQSNVTAPKSVIERVRELSTEFGVDLSIDRHWPNESGTGHYCRAYGVLTETDFLRVELAASISVGTHADDVDLFVLVNGVRVAPTTNPTDYLHRDGNGQFRWDDIDEGFDGKNDLDSLLLRRG